MDDEVLNRCVQVGQTAAVDATTELVCSDGKEHTLC